MLILIEYHTFYGWHPSTPPDTPAPITQTEWTVFSFHCLPVNQLFGKRGLL